MPPRKILNRSPNMSILPAEVELQTVDAFNPMGAVGGGLSLFSNSFKRGYGDKVFGNDDNGLWMGAADYANAPFRSDYDGNVVLNSVLISGYIPDGGALDDIGLLGITETYIANDAISTPKLQANSVTANEINALAVTAGKIAANAIESSNIQAGQVKAVNIEANTITASQIAANTITASQIAASTITAGQIATNAIEAVKIKAGAVESAKIQSNVSLSGLTEASQLYAGVGAFGGSGRTPSDPVDVDGNIYCFDFRLYTGKDRFVFKDTAGAERMSLFISGTNSELRMNNFNLKLTSNKTAIIPVGNAYKALYCIESPEVWFMDFVDNLDEEDPIFKEVTAGDAKVIELKHGGYQIWRRRKGHEDLRFEDKTEEEFLINEAFYRKARK